MDTDVVALLKSLESPLSYNDGNDSWVHGWQPGEETGSLLAPYSTLSCIHQFRTTTAALIILCSIYKIMCADGEEQTISVLRKYLLFIIYKTKKIGAITK
jgi:hypothetical protein